MESKSNKNEFLYVESNLTQNGHLKMMTGILEEAANFKTVTFAD